ncbi:MAG TPA: ATP-dependent DNA helicase [Lachnospiraceae bacterium]|nr:ATP-dependent DNA helicase [Lachnospiraceae bacterium]
MSLNASQLAAVAHFKGPMMVLAGPGSGKTTVITKRTEELVREHRVNPENILVVTFTREAARQMGERFESNTGGDIYGVTFSTFHSLFYHIIADAFRGSKIEIISEEDQRTLVTNLVKEILPEVQDAAEMAGSVISEIGIVKNERIALKDYKPSCTDIKKFNEIYVRYHKELREAGLADFDDLQAVCFNLLSTKKEILEKWRNKYKFILIDEFQDINKIQYDIMKLIAEPLNNIFIVGDDDQSIYRFRGAKPEIMKQFKEEHADCKTVLLDTNYRSGAEIVNTSLKVIGHNRNRFDKKLLASNNTKIPVQLMEFPNVKMEYESVIKLIKLAHECGERYSETAVLFRTVNGISSLIYQLSRNNIPYIVNGAMPDMFEHWVVQDLMSYLRMAEGEMSVDDFVRVMNKPKRYISRDGAKAGEYVNETTKQHEISMELMKRYYRMKDKHYMIRNLDQLIIDLNFVKRCSLFAGIMYIRNGGGYDSYLREYAMKQHVAYEELVQVADEFADYAKDYNSLEELEESIKEYKENAKEKKRESSRTDGVRLMTFHSSKGLEFKRCIIVNAIETITPHKKAESAEELEEERRMFYVAMTRAKNQLIIDVPDEFFDRQQRMSRFVREAELTPMNR